MKFKLKDPGSAITHGIGMLLAVAGATPLIVKAARSADVLHVFAVSVFILTMILLYLASTLYHSVNSLSLFPSPETSQVAPSEFSSRT